MLYLLRHGLDDESYIGGWSDVSLTKEGEKQVLRSAVWMKNHLAIQKIISSDIKRAKETSEIVGRVFHLPFDTDINLREQNKGLLNGIKKTEALERYPEYMEGVDIFTVYPQGESLKDLYVRCKNYLEKLNEVDGTLLVTHRGNINMIYYLLYGKELDMDKEQFGVGHASVHELDMSLKKIRRIY